MFGQADKPFKKFCAGHHADKNKNAVAWQRFFLSGADIVQLYRLDFAFALESRFGPEYLWNSSNLKAFANLPMEAAHKAVVLEQWKQIRELPPHPAAYMVERSLSDLWNSVVVEGRTSRLAADRANVEADREIVRKLEEFGYAQNGELTRPYPVPETSLAGGAP